MTTSIWMTLATPAGHADLYLNGMPAIRLGAQHAIRMPITEYTQHGLNRLQIRPSRPEGRWREAGEVAIRVEEARFEGDALLELVTLLDSEAACDVTNPAPLDLGSFRSAAGAAPDLDRLSVLDPSATPFILAELGRIANLWRGRDWPALVGFLDGYIRDYTSAYAVETPENYTESFVRMASSFMERGEVVFNEIEVDLDFCAGGKLVDCLSKRGGAAIKVRQPDGSDYDFNLLVGAAGRTMIAVR